MSVVYWHKNCCDGIAAAFACYLKNPDWTYTPIQYGDVIDYPKENKIFVDYCPEFSEIKAMSKDGFSITILDHHKTREEDFKKAMEQSLIKGVFDLNRSGAGISYDYFKPDVSRDLFSLIEDRDLWRWQLEGAKELNAFITGQLSFEKLKEAMDNLPRAIEIGKFMVKQAEGIIDKCCATSYYEEIAGVTMPVVNSPFFQSEICAKLLLDTKHPVACCWYEVEDKIIHSLRSIKEYDCSNLAKKYGGGGHCQASGFTIKKG